MTAKLDAAEKQQVVAMYESGQSCREIAVFFDMATRSIHKLLQRRNVRMRTYRESRQDTPRDEAFDTIAPDTAYWLGFIFADGCIYKRPRRSYEIKISLAAVDWGHLEKFRAFLGSSRPIGVTANGGYPACQFRVTSDRLARQVLDYGRYGGPLAPNLASSRDFWRGLVDGDGHLAFGSNGYATFNVVGERRLLEPFLAFLNRWDLGGRMRPRPYGKIYVVSTIGPLAARIIGLLYDDATTALDRKAEVARRVRSAPLRADRRSTRGGPHPAFTPAQAERAAMLLNEKDETGKYRFQVVEVAAKLGVSYTTIRRHCGRRRTAQYHASLAEEPVHIGGTAGTIPDVHGGPPDRQRSHLSVAVVTGHRAVIAAITASPPVPSLAFRTARPVPAGRVRFLHCAAVHLPEQLCQLITSIGISMNDHKNLAVGACFLQAFTKIIPDDFGLTP